MSRKQVKYLNKLAKRGRKHVKNSKIRAFYA